MTCWRPSRSCATSSRRSADVLIDPLSLHRELRGPNPPAVLDVRWKLGDADGRRHYAERPYPERRYVDLDTELAAAPSPSEGRHPLPEIEELQGSARRWGLSRDRPSSSTTTTVARRPLGPGGCCAGPACRTSACWTARSGLDRSRLPLERAVPADRGDVAGRRPPAGARRRRGGGAGGDRAAARRARAGALSRRARARRSPRRPHPRRGQRADDGQPGRRRPVPRSGRRCGHGSRPSASTTAARSASTAAPA